MVTSSIQGGGREGGGDSPFLPYLALMDAVRALFAAVRSSDWFAREMLTAKISETLALMRRRSRSN